MCEIDSRGDDVAIFGIGNWASLPMAWGFFYGFVYPWMRLTTDFSLYLLHDRVGLPCDVFHLGFTARTSTRFRCHFNSQISLNCVAAAGLNSESYQGIVHKSVIIILLSSLHCLSHTTVMPQAARHSPHRRSFSSFYS
jgi:hypothetical protein